MKYAAILFDLDGTLIETTDLYEQACIEAFALVKIQMTKAEFGQLYARGWTLPQWLTHYNIEEIREPELRKKRDDLYVELLKKKTRWREGAHHMLSHVKKHAPTAVVTGAWKKYVHAMEQCIPLTKYMNTIVTADEVGSRMKPDPYGLIMAANRLQVEPHECIYIGDQEIDMLAANAAGMQSCLVPHVHTTLNAHAKANHVAYALDDIRRFV